MYKKFFEVNVDKYEADKHFKIFYPSSLNRPRSNSVMFVMKKYLGDAGVLRDVSECLIFWPRGCDISKGIRNHNVVIESEEPRKSYIRFFYENGIINLPQQESYDVVNGAIICKGAQIGQNCVIMPGAYISSETEVGDNTYIGCGTKIVGSAHIGKNVVIRENTTIGADGLSTERDTDGSALTMPQFGGVTIEDRVQIGAGVVIARGAIDDTLIGEGSKIDNSSFISHNVKLGRNVFVVGETIMMGSSKAEDGAYISGNSVIRNKITIGEDAFIGMGSVVTKNIEEGVIVMGNPAKERNK